MQKKEMVVGGKYALRSAKYWMERPVMLIDVDKMWMWHRKVEGRTGGGYRTLPHESKPGRYDYTYQRFGYLVVIPDRVSPDAEEMLRGVTVDEVLNDGNIDTFVAGLPEGLGVEVVNNRHLIGVWSVVKAQMEANKLAEAIKHKELDELAVRRKAAHASLVERAAEFGVNLPLPVKPFYGDRFREMRVELTFDQLAKLLDAAEKRD